MREGRVELAISLAEAGRYDEAARILIDAAGASDPEAQFTLGLWRIGGTILRRDLASAREWLSKAAAAGHAEAGLIHAYFLAGGIGGPDDWASALGEIRKLAPREPRAAAQARLLERLGLDGSGLPAKPLPRENLSDSPRAACARAFASEEECDHLVTLAAPNFTPSVVVDPVSRRLVPNPVRTSEGAFFGVTQEDLVVNALNRRISALTGTTLPQAEPLQVLRYKTGMEYKPHVDALPSEPNQRILTVLLYLNDDYEGGETRFVKTGLSFKGRQGDALMFWNILPNGAADPAAQHAGLPVRRGVKLIASRWIRAGRFVYPPPVPVTGNRFG